MTTNEQELISKLDKIKWQLCDLFENQDDIALVINEKLDAVKTLEKQLKLKSPDFFHEHPFNAKPENIILHNQST